MPDLRVTSVEFTAAPRSAADSGLLGWATFIVTPGLRLGGVAVRRRVWILL